MSKTVLCLSWNGRLTEAILIEDESSIQCHLDCMTVLYCQSDLIKQPIKSYALTAIFMEFHYLVARFVKSWIWA